MDAIYEKMWNDLGMDIKTHDKMLAHLEKVYTKVFRSQANRPDGMKYFDGQIDNLHSGRVMEIKDQKDRGKKVVGIFCVFVPDEITLAADAIQVGLCAGAEVGFNLAEKYLPRNTCALVKSFFGFKLTKLSPYMEIADLVVGETTCDQKKKSYEIMNDFYPLYIIEVPQRKESCDRDLWKEEVLRFKDRIEELTGNKITPENLKNAIKTVNDRRRALNRLNMLRSSNPAPISGLDCLLINQVGFYDDPQRFTHNLNILCDELEQRIEEKSGAAGLDAARFFVTGCPMALPNWKLPMIVESMNGVIVGEEACVGSRHTRELVDESGETLEEMLNAIVDRYLNIDCACFTPNRERLANIVSQARTLNADGIINYNLTFCQPYLIETHKVEEICRNENIPILSLETDYSMEDRGQLKTRLEAFMEMVK